VSDDVLNPRTAERLVRAARAAQTLSEALWEALHEELIDPRGLRVAELSERLAEVSTAVASLARVDAAAISVQAQTQATPGDDATERPPTSERPPAGERPDAPAEPRSRVVSVEHDEHGPSRASFSPRDAPPTREETSSAAVLVDELAPEETIAPPVSSAQEPPAALEASVLVTPEIEIRDERGDRAAAAWIASIGRRLERYERDGVPFAVLLIELADVERLRHAELPGEVARLTGLVETALANELSRPLLAAGAGDRLRWRAGVGRAPGRGRARRGQPSRNAAPGRGGFRHMPRRRQSGGGAGSARGYRALRRAGRGPADRLITDQK
jgi:hypothetical protein